MNLKNSAAFISDTLSDSRFTVAGALVQAKAYIWLNLLHYSKGQGLLLELRGNKIFQITLENNIFPQSLKL